MIKSILSRSSRRVILMQLIGNAVLGALFAAWLQIPDSHAWQFVLSMIMAAVLVVGALELHAATVQRMRAADARVPLWFGALLLAGWLVAWDGMTTILLLFQNNIEVRAGYWNSKLPAYGRTLFTYPRLISWQENALAVVLWWILPCLLLPLIMESVACGLRIVTWRKLPRIYLRWELWVTMAAASWCGLWLTDEMVDWHPSYTVHGELISMMLRFAVVYAIDVLLYCAVLAVIAALLARESAGRNTGVQPSPDGGETVTAN